MYFQQNRKSHQHRFFLDINSGDMVCTCGKKKREVHEKANKYHNIPKEYNGEIYHSTFERDYAAELDFRKKCGDIKEWERQVKLDLRVNGQHICNYYIDFIVTHNDGTREFVEVKGMEMPLWKVKWAILEATFDDFKLGLDDFLTVVKQQKQYKKHGKKRTDK